MILNYPDLSLTTLSLHSRFFDHNIPTFFSHYIPAFFKFDQYPWTIIPASITFQLFFLFPLHSRFPIPRRTPLPAFLTPAQVPHDAAANSEYDVHAQLSILVWRACDGELDGCTAALG